MSPSVEPLASALAWELGSARARGCTALVLILRCIIYFLSKSSDDLKSLA